MQSAIKHARVRGKLLMVGFGCVGQAVLPLLLRHLEVRPDQIAIVAASAAGEEIAREFGVDFEQLTLTEANYGPELAPRLNAGDFLLNLSIDVSSLALIELCWQHDALYLDASIEPWAGGYTDTSRSVSQRSNYALREAVLAFGRDRRQGPTALVTQGANPGLASSFVKQALMNIAAESGKAPAKPFCPEAWAALAQQLDIRTIHIAERDSQTSQKRKQRDEFVNTWSVAGFIGEGTQPSELGWGSHERYWPADAARHDFGCDAAIYLNRPGMATRVRSWTPLEGSYHGFLVTHGESISIADHLTLWENGTVIYRPTVHYAYHPCDDAVLSVHEIAGKNWRPQSTQCILRDEIVNGVDELGVLLMGNARGIYWFGSRLSIAAARRLAPLNSATSLQVAAGVLAGMVWALRHPHAGVVEPDDIDHEAVLAIAKPYLGELVGVHGDWTPLQGRTQLFGEDVAGDDPWQFKNFRVL